MAEQLIVWASVSYALGFLTVLLHTARLGLPILELLKPVYVWIGLPLATAAFFSKHVLRALREHLEATSHAMRVTLESEVASAAASLTVLFNPLLKAITNAVPFGILQPLFLWLVQRLLQMTQGGAVPERGVRVVRTLTRLVAMADAIRPLVRVAALTLVAVAALASYVWDLYPRIPQSFGGGAPIAVEMSLDLAKVPPALDVTLGLARPTDSIARSLPALTERVDLLYATGIAYYVRTPGGHVVALDRAAVTAIVWQ